MIDYNKLATRAYACAVKRGQVTEDTTVSEILCDCMAELAEAWEASKIGNSLAYHTCFNYTVCDEVCGRNKSECEKSGIRKFEGVAVELSDAVICLI